MKLIDTTSLAIRDFLGTTTGIQYAILSHTWGDDGDEVTFQEMSEADRSIVSNKPGYHKILKVCELARSKPYELQYAWVDTCCIDKTSSAELTEAINSMFRYYQNAAVCFAHLADWEITTGPLAFSTSRWFKRGWTLQELVAPAPEKLVFLDQGWKNAGTKLELSEQISSATRIDVLALDGTEPLHDIPVAVRMSWAAHRETRRDEDRAYSLLGIFDINMPMLYGEGSNAFQRLQAEIITHSTDMSIFAWRANSDSQKYTGLLATSPEVFGSMSLLVLLPYTLLHLKDYSLTNRGMRFQMPLNQDPETGYFILPVNHGFLNARGEHEECGVFLRQVGADLFVRAYPREFCANAPAKLASTSYTLKSETFHVKTLTSKQSALIDERALNVQNDQPQNLLKLERVEPVGCWDPSENLLYAGHTGIFLGYMIFTTKWADEFDFFVLVCYCALGQWRHALVRGDEWEDLQPRLNMYYQDGHNMEIRSSSLELPHLFLNGISKNISASIKGGPSERRQALSLRFDSKGVSS